MKFLALAVGLCALVASSTASADQTCKAKAIDEKLAGEALVNFVKQCESDAYMACAEAAHKMLAEPANENAIHTCVAKAVGTGPMWCDPHYCKTNSDCTGGAGCNGCWAGLCGQ
jgi:hypothetical protein